MVGHQQPTPVYTQPVCFAPNMMYPVPVSPGVQVSKERLEAFGGLQTGLLELSWSWAAGRGGAKASVRSASPASPVSQDSRIRLPSWQELPVPGAVRACPEVCY